MAQAVVPGAPDAANQVAVQLKDSCLNETAFYLSSYILIYNIFILLEYIYNITFKR